MTRLFRKPFVATLAILLVLMGLSTPTQVRAGATTTVTNVASTTANGSYKTGDSIQITIKFNAIVTVDITGGTPTLCLETGATDHCADYSSGSDTGTLIFNFTVQADDTSADLDYVTTGSLTLNGGTIQDLTPVDATLTLPTPGASGSLGFNSAIVIDTEKPVVSAFTVTSPSTSLNIPITGFSASDNTSVTGYKITESSTAPLAGDSGWSGTAPTTYTVAGSGSYTLYPWAKDAAGNISLIFGTPRTVTVDASKPVVNTFTVTSPSSSLNIPVTAFSASDNTSVTGYKITESSTAPLAGDSGWAGTAPTTYTVAGSGSYTLYPWAKDAAGNISLVFGTPRTVTVDASKPVVNTFTVTSPSVSLYIPITAFTASDNTGVTGFLITQSATVPSAGDSGWSGTAPTTYLVPSDGFYTLYPWAKDAAGNVSALRTSQTVTVDSLKVLFGSYSSLDLQSSISEIVATDNWLTSNGASGVTFAGDFMSLTFNPAWNVHTELDAAWDAGFMPFVNLMPSETWETSQGYYDSNCDTAADIAAGLCDAKISTWAGHFKTWAGSTKQAYIAPMPEMNGGWTVYASDGATYITAFRRIRSLFVSAGVPASAVRWVFAPNGWNDPATAWRQFENFYPGDAYVDIVSFSAYNYGGCPIAYAAWDTFDTAMKPYLDRMRIMAPTKPIFISQTGVIGVPVDGSDASQTKSIWVEDTFSKLADYPAVRAILYFNKINTPETVGTCGSPDYRIFYGGNSGEAGFLNIMKDSRFEKLNLNSTKWDDVTTVIFAGPPPPAPIFVDVPFSYWANGYIERLYGAAITGGCITTPLSYCPDSTVTRAQMAIFLEKGKHYPASYSPPAALGTVFTDVSSSYWAAAWIEKLAQDGITGGCGNSNYCPDNIVTRAQMAVFLLKAKHGSAYTPPAPVGTFSDVPTNYWAAAWIEQLAIEGITGGCGVGVYCPDNQVTRAQMAVFLVKTFGLP